MSLLRTVLFASLAVCIETTDQQETRNPHNMDARVHCKRQNAYKTEM